MKRRIYPTLRPPVEDENEPILGPRANDSDDGLSLPRRIILTRYSSERATGIARAYRCPSHGRNPRAKGSPDGDDWRFEGLCCREAERSVRAELFGAD
jgi:hypothetical protein